jgi:L-asparaginase
MDQSTALNPSGAARKVLVLNTGGTLEKVYDEHQERMVLSQKTAIEKLLESARISDLTVRKFKLIDSLEMDDAYRAELMIAVARNRNEGVIIVHGTGTITTTAEYLAERVQGKTVVLTGSILPLQLDPTEAAANLGGAVAAARYLPHGVYVALHGVVEAAGHCRLDRDRKRLMLKTDAA